MADFAYLCGCGHTYPSYLGKYGCPNCGGSAAARLVKKPQPKPKTNHA
jgi:hypothetical protein